MAPREEMFDFTNMVPVLQVHGKDIHIGDVTSMRQRLVALISRTSHFLLTCMCSQSGPLRPKRRSFSWSLGLMFTLEPGKIQ